MYISVPKDQLIKTLTRCSAIASGKHSLPVLACVHLRPGESILRIRVTDLDIGYETTIANIVWMSEFIEDSAALLPAAKLLEMVKAIPVGMVDISCINIALQVYTIKGGTVQFTIHGLDPEEYPARPEMDCNTSVVTLHGKDLKTALGHVAYCQSKDINKHNLCGARLKIEENDDNELFIFAAAADGHRLCVTSEPFSDNQDNPLPAAPSIPVSFISGSTIPGKVITEIQHLDTENHWQLSICGNHLCVDTGIESLAFRLPEGDFPDTDRVIPKNINHTVIVNRQPLIDAISRVRIATTKENYRGIRLQFADNSINLSSHLPEHGLEAYDHVTCDIEGDPQPVKISAEYLTQALANIPHSQVKLQFVDNLAPVLITPCTTDFPQAVVMPMRGDN